MSVGIVVKLIREGQLLFKLFFDRRVPIWVKVIPIFTFGYVISPIDFFPDLILILGQVDDAGVAILGWQTFRHLVPKDILEEHVAIIDPNHVPPTELELRQSYKLKAKNTPEQ